MRMSGPAADYELQLCMSRMVSKFKIEICAKHIHLLTLIRVVANQQVGKEVSKHFPGYGTFTGFITFYAPKTDTYKIVYSG